MTIYYKLTDATGQTRDNTQWGPGVRHEATGPPDGVLCSDSWIHCYTDPLLAAFLNPVHGNFQAPRCWEVEIDGEVKTDHGLKVGARGVTTTREIPLPGVTHYQRVRFGILCALAVYTDAAFVRWANAWLDGTDRTEAAARVARLARVLARVAEEVAAEAAADAAVGVVWAAVEAARAAEAAAEAAPLDLVAIARKAMEEQP